MGCLLVLMMAVSPRLVIFLFWLARPLQFDAAFGGPILPLLGIVFLPFTTLMYVVLLHARRRPERCRLDLARFRGRRGYRALRVRGDQERVHGGPPLAVMLAALAVTISPHPLGMRRVRWTAREYRHAKPLPSPLVGHQAGATSGGNYVTTIRHGQTAHRTASPAPACCPDRAARRVQFRRIGQLHLLGRDLVDGRVLLLVHGDLDLHRPVRRHLPAQ